MPFFAHDGMIFHWQERGSGTPFIFQHGLGGDVCQPLNLFSPLDGIRLIAFDCRAHGLTRPLGEESKIGFQTFVEDLCGLII